MKETAELKNAPLAVVVEADSLTSWSLESFLAAIYRVAMCSTLEQAAPYLNDPHLQLIICGDEDVSVNPCILQLLVDHPTVQVIALLSNIDKPVPQNIVVVEKPFALEQLEAVLNR